MSNLILITTNEDYDKRQSQLTELSLKKEKTSTDQVLYTLLKSALDQYQLRYWSNTN